MRIIVFNISYTYLPDDMHFFTTETRYRFLCNKINRYNNDSIFGSSRNNNNNLVVTATLYSVSISYIWRNSAANFTLKKKISSTNSCANESLLSALIASLYLLLWSYSSACWTSKNTVLSNILTILIFIFTL